MKRFLFYFRRADFGRQRGIFFYLLLILLPLGRRKILAQYTGGFDEYETLFLYLSDIVLILFLIFSFKDIWRFIKAWRSELWFWPLTVFSVSALISTGLAEYHWLALFDFLRLVAIILLALGIGAGIRAGYLKLRHIFLILIILGFFEALLGFSQFALQHSVGLQAIGEPYLPDFSALTAGAKIPAGLARIDIAGGKLIRSYGTFPHPNVLAAFLLLTLTSLFYFWLKNIFPWKFWWRHSFAGIPKREFFIYVLREIFLGLGIFIVALGLLFAFSRTAWLMALALALTFSIFGFLLTAYRRQAVKLFFLSSAIILLLLGNFGVFILPRAHISLGESAVTYRLRYNEVAVSLVKDHPLGVGLGNEVIYLVKNQIYQQFGMTQLWEWQPIHNIYLLMASEIGVLGAVAFVVLISLLIIKNLIYQFKSDLPAAEKLEFFTVLAILVSLLLFGLTDHFLWTLEPGRLMLWVVLGIMISISCPRSSTG